MHALLRQQSPTGRGLSLLATAQPMRQGHSSPNAKCRTVYYCPPNFPFLSLKSSLHVFAEDLNMVNMAADPEL